ncbi:hypothetical protein FOIG_16960 [Fusarium odoratissimum NRRL 54006]|uniref:Uncharacterized protein n=1 Tax=Fusarium odoratissimum (strain NRRL 54006) TaxID=1089451 RepID=X0J084_FUSO5|nr:uncharacterized protein FOIG_16960 [Fusarium odoratissimum NRRL 54006]EXL89756.1 hypothetical protein FOIG_16960 [Fusarium odoratissimum NRRL 54006]
MGTTRHEVVVGPGTTRSWNAVGPAIVGPSLVAKELGT